MSKSKKLVFFGSGDLGLSSLKTLEAEFEIVLVATKPKSENHKGKMPVYDYCLEKGLNLITPINKKELQDQLLSLGYLSDLGVAVDYGIIISQAVIDSFSLGIVNSHFSLLPAWRGADPITFPILAGQNQSGVTFMMIDRGMDTGKIIASFPLNLSPDETQESLTRKLLSLSDQKIVSIVQSIFNRKNKLIDQSGYLITYSRMLYKPEREFNLNKPASLLEREIRAFQTWPKSKLNILGINCTIKNATSAERLNLSLGEIKIVDNRILVGCGRGSHLEIIALQPDGKKTMPAADFIRGYSRN